MTWYLLLPNVETSWMCCERKKKYQCDSNSKCVCYVFCIFAWWSWWYLCSWFHCKAMQCVSFEPLRTSLTVLGDSVCQTPGLTGSRTQPWVLQTSSQRGVLTLDHPTCGNSWSKEMVQLSSSNRQLSMEQVHTQVCDTCNQESLVR